MIQLIITIIGLSVFEIISSIDNAIVNAHVLKTLPDRFRKLFLTWGLFLAVFVMRGALPFAIVWLSGGNVPGEESKGLLLLGGGVYLVLVFLAWLFLEEKKYAFFVEHFIHRQSVWFYAFASLFFLGVVFIALKVNPLLALAASIGSTAFFITDGFKKNAETQEQKLLSSHASAWSKILYLEVLDASFSIDGVIGAFAFTVSIPLILIGNGIGAFVVREITIRGINFVDKFAYLKNGAMYSIGMLGGLMVMESFGQHYPFWLAPLNTFSLLGLFLYLSYRESQLNLKLKNQNEKLH